MFPGCPRLSSAQCVETSLFCSSFSLAHPSLARYLAWDLVQNYLLLTRAPLASEGNPSLIAPSLLTHTELSKVLPATRA